MAELSFQPLTPTSFLERSGSVFADRLAVIDGDDRFTYAELTSRAKRLAGALTAIDVAPGDRVAVLAPNTHLLLEAHHGIPWAGAVAVPLNTRLKAAELSYIVEHSGANVLLYDESLADSAEEVAKELPDVRMVAGNEYEELVEGADEHVVALTDERSLFALNYTSGTTGQPKGVMYSPRGAYLQGLAMALHLRLTPSSVYLWTLPMFHCNGWCFPYAVTAAGAVHRCLRQIDPAEIWEAIRNEGVTHLCAAPTVLNSIVNHEAAEDGPAPQPVIIGTGGAPPSPTLLGNLAELNMDVTHLYGLTETYGPFMISQWRPEWNDLWITEQAERKARQGVGNVVATPPRVVDDDGDDVPADGKTMGQIAARGNDVMLGYYRDDEATAEDVPDGWFRTGDLGVMHADGYIELRDRSKDVIISGGENIASIEVEQAIDSHPSVIESAVIALPHERWGEVPAAYVTLKEGEEVSEQDIIDHVRSKIANYKAPKHVEFRELPKTSTGKIQKFVLRDEAQEADSS